MSEAKFNMKGPAGAIVAVIAIGVFVYMEFFMPFSITSRDKKAILEKIESIKLSKMTQIATSTTKQFKETGKVTDDLKEIKELTGDVNITEVTGKKSFLSGTKVKVVYTIAGKTPKADGGVMYFKLYRRKKRKGRISRNRRVELTKISKETYEASLFGSRKEKAKKEEKEKTGW